MISVVVSAYNRAELLRNCLDSLLAQEGNVEFEVLVVDNNSKDETAAVAQEYAARDPRIKYFLETNQGLSYVRNRGVQESKGDFVAFIDEDAKAASNWLANAEQMIRTVKPEIFGGPIYPYYSTPKLDWMEDKYYSYSHEYEDGELAEGQFLSGSNFFVRKELIRELGGFNPDLGMKGKEMSYHEETNMQILARQRGVKALYSKALVVYHHVAANRYYLPYYIYANYLSGRSSTRVWGENGEVKDFLRLQKSMDEAIEFMAKTFNEGDPETREKKFIAGAPNYFYTLGVLSAIVSNQHADPHMLVRRQLERNVQPGQAVEIGDSLVMRWGYSRRARFKMLLKALRWLVRKII